MGLTVLIIKVYDSLITHRNLVKIAFSKRVVYVRIITPGVNYELWFYRYMLTPLFLNLSFSHKFFICANILI